MSAPGLSPLVQGESPELFWLTGFNGVNLHDDRRAIDDQECFWLENFDPLGASNARTMYDNGAALYTTTGTIVYDFTFNLATVFYKAIFLADGSAVAVKISDGTTASMGAAATFNVTTLPCCAQWGASGIVIVTANNYYAWDGAGGGTLYSPNTVAPAWLSGLAASLVPTGNTNTSTSITNLSSSANIVIGMKITGTDIPANTYINAFTSTTITLSQAATGTTAGVTFTINWAIPTGLSGQAVEIYTSRVWILNNATGSFSAPSNGADFSTADGGGTFKSSDQFLKAAFINLKQANGFLYLFGDGSVNVISNVQTSGSPSTTTFNNQNVDPQNGLAWRDCLVYFMRALVFANPSGVYVLYGGAATKISDKIDYLFQKANFATVTPTMFVCDIFNVTVVGIVLNTYDPTVNQQRTIMALWNGSRWFIASQTRITTYATILDSIGNTPHQAWGNDGKNVYQMFSTASSTLLKKAVSKLWAGNSNLNKKLATRAYVETSDLAQTGVIINGTLDSDENSAVPFSMTATLQFQNNTFGNINFTGAAGGALTWISNPAGVQGVGAQQAGKRLGMTLTSTSQDFELIGMGETYREEAYYG